MLPHFPRKSRQILVGYGKDQTGSISVFALTLFLLMVMMGGLAVDLMKHEQIRVQLQNTLDRCTLMAASIDQRLDAETVVRDCVEKAGLLSQLASVTAVTGENSRDVRTTGLAPTKPRFLHLMGIDKLDATAASAANQNLSNIELSMVLDVSGSMNGAKIAALRVAASEFVETVLATDTRDRVSISLVPYNGQVNLGAKLRAKYNATDMHGVENVNCLDLPSGVYGDTTMPTTMPMPMTGHVDTFSNTWQTIGYLPATDGWAIPNPLNRWCPVSATNIVRPPSNDVTTLQSQITALTAVGATSINAGLKWGLTLLDPASRPMVGSLIADHDVDVKFAGRPVDYDDPDTIKIVVLMTDGSHFPEERLKDGYRTGPSNIWRNPSDQLYSIFHATKSGPDQYWVPEQGVWQSTPWGGAAAVEQDWQTIWTNQRMSWVAWQLYGRAAGPDVNAMQAAYTAAISAMRSKTAVVEMDAQLQQICTMAKDKNVIIYGIAFEAPLLGQAQISQCATSDLHYYDAGNPAEMQAAFRSIATNITQLKLTQ